MVSYCVGVTFQEGFSHAHTSRLGPDANTIARTVTCNEKNNYIRGLRKVIKENKAVPKALRTKSQS